MRGNVIVEQNAGRSGFHLSTLLAVVVICTLTLYLGGVPLTYAVHLSTLTMCNGRPAPQPPRLAIDGGVSPHPYPLPYTGHPLETGGIQRS